jgi:hypothetical protein
LGRLADAVHSGGSGDKLIDPDTIKVNNFAKFFLDHRSIRHVFFNSKQAETYFRDLFLSKLTDAAAKQRVEKMLQDKPLPSSSNSYSERNRLSDGSWTPRVPTTKGKSPTLEKHQNCLGKEPRTMKTRLWRNKITTDQHRA